MMAKRQATQLADHQVYLEASAPTGTKISDNDLFQFMGQE